MARIHIASYLGAARVSRGDGARLRQAIVERWQDDEPVVLDFSDVTIASVSFFDESIGLLAREHPLAELTRHVQVVNIDASDRALLNQIVTSRAREREITVDAAAPETDPDVT